MDKDQILRAKARGEEVMNGFKRPRTQNANDAVALADLALRQAGQIQRLRQELTERGQPSLFESIFGK